MVDSILVFCAHSDDQVFGVGGALKNYSLEGLNVITVIFSQGEQSHPWFKEEITVEMRMNESLKAEKVIGGKETIFFSLSEGKFLSDARKLGVKKRIKDIINEYKPIKIFTHSSSDPHPDHKSTEKLVLEVFDSMRFNCDIYTFDVWNPLNLKASNAPRLVVDISHTFKYKLRALKCFKSQRLAMLSLMWSVYFKAIVHGLQHHYRFAEVFYKVR
jgi:LmbE family N-acetylglucosaminyl deacetylase